MSSSVSMSRNLYLIVCHVMHCAALVTYSFAFLVYTDGIELDQNRAAFSTYADQRIETVTAKHELASIFRVFPERNIFCLTADMTRFHKYFLQNSFFIIACRTGAKKIACLCLMMYIIVN
jgi:hypothetical protein